MQIKRKHKERNYCPAKRIFNLILQRKLPELDEHSGIFNPKEKNQYKTNTIYQPSIQYIAKTFSEYEEEMMTFSCKWNVRGIKSSIHDLRQIPEGVLQPEVTGY